jgi:hypothetical protein
MHDGGGAAVRVYALIFLLCFLDCLTTYFLLLKHNNVDLEFNPLLRFMIRYDYRYVFVYVFFEFSYFAIAYTVVHALRVRARIRVKLEYSVFILLLLAIVSNTAGLLLPATYK